DPIEACATITDALALGCAAVQISPHPPGDRAPSHPEVDVVWDLLSEAGVPVLLHSGTGGPPIDPRWRDNGLPTPPDFTGGPDGPRAVDVMFFHRAAETFLTVLVLDGVFERHPGLRVGCLETGALWLVPWLLQLDLVQDG